VALPFDDDGLPSPDPGDDAPASPPPFRLDGVSVPRIRLDVESRQALPGRLLRAVYPRDRVWVHALLLLATLLTTTLVGMQHWLSFQFFMGRTPGRLSVWSVVAGGLWYSVALLAILGAHEMGHYLACVRYKVNASLPYFLPVPPPFIAGTMGAFIKIRAPIRTKRQLFDIGIAGPLAGFAVTVPVLFLGLALSTVVPEPKNIPVQEFADPLLFKLADWIVLGRLRDGLMLNAHPLVFAAWFGCLATSLNLFPIGQLDGGHIAYAVLGRRSTVVTFGALACTVGLTFVSLSWLAWTVLIVVMLYAFGPHHPRTVDEDVPLGRGRLALAAAAVAMLVLCFMASPINEVILGR
jgi:membrane-associated protease RseP (regulator of RpoE activity)